MITFVINGEPEAKQRPRMSIRNGYARAYTPKATANYENKVMLCYQEAIKDMGLTDYLFKNGDYVKISIVAYFSLSKGDYGKKGLNKSGRYKIDNVYCDKHKDLDNIVKIVLDGLNHVAYRDDKQVVSIEAQKVWTELPPKVVVCLERIN